MAAYLIKPPLEIPKASETFEGILSQIHETAYNQKISFEVLATRQNISFYLFADDETASVVSGLIYAAFPGSEVVAAPDPLEQIGKNDRIAGADFCLTKSYLLPLKSYEEFEKDSLSPLLSVLSQCGSDEEVLFQVIIQPVKDSGLMNLKLSLDKKFEKAFRPFQMKYWLKKRTRKLYDTSIEEKTKNRLFKVNVRACVISKDLGNNPRVRLGAISAALSHFNTLDLNGFKARGRYGDRAALRLFYSRRFLGGFLLSIKELATIYHLPDPKSVPNIVHVLSKKAAPPRELPVEQGMEVSLFGETNFREQRTKFGIKQNDRRRHLYILGKSGSGKSKLMELLILNDLLAGRGIAVLDPHGDLVDNVLRLVPRERISDVVLFDPSDLHYPPAFNPLEKVPEELKMRVTLGFIEIFKKLFGANWSDRLEHVLRYTTLALLDTPNTTVLSILKMLTDKNYRQMIIGNIQDSVVKNFWVNEFSGWSQKFDAEAITPLLNKVGQFVATNMIRNIVGQPENRFDFRDIMDNKKILLMKISKGILGEENASLLGAMAVTKIYQAAMSRADIPEDKRVDFYFYVDEFHNFATESFDEILSEARKYRLNLTIANQFLGQLTKKMTATIFGNVATLISFRVGAEDAAVLAGEFAPRFSERDLINLPVRDFCIKMSIDGEVKEAFSGRTLNIRIPESNYRAKCIEHSRKHYSLPLVEVEKILKSWDEGKFTSSLSDKQSGEEGENIKFETPIV